MNKAKLLLLTASLICFNSLLIAYFYMEGYLGLEPCPLCILDRFVIGIIGILFFLVYLFFPRLFIPFFSVILVLLVTGFIIAVRHIYLVYFPQAFSCSFDDSSFSIIKFITDAFIGTEDCGAVTWSFFGLNIPELTFLLYIVITIFTFKIFKCYKVRRKNIFL